MKTTPLRAILTGKDAIELHRGRRWMLNPQLVRRPTVTHDGARKVAGINSLLSDMGVLKAVAR